MLALAPRLMGKLVYRDAAPLGTDVWGDTALGLTAGMPRRWIDLFTGERVDGSHQTQSGEVLLGSVFNTFPVAVLYHEEGFDESQVIEENLHAAGIEHSP